MNARQKAKRYKRELEFLKCKQIEPIILKQVDYQVVPLRVSESVGLESYLSNTVFIQEHIDEIAQEHLLKKLSKYLDEYVEIEKEKDTDYGTMTFTATLLVGKRTL